MPTLSSPSMNKKRHAATTVLICFGVALGAIVLLIGGLALYAAFDREDTFAVANAELADAGYLQRLAGEGYLPFRRSSNFAVYAHRLKRGPGTVFGLRTYMPGKLGVIDDESYRKVTLWMAGAAPATSADLPVGDDARVRLLITDGGSAWLHSACSHVGVGGTVRIERIGRRFRVTIRAATAVSGQSPPQVLCRDGEVDLTFEAKEIAFADLTPWLGVEGRDPFEETYRPLWR